MGITAILVDTLRPPPWYPTRFRSLHLILRTNKWDARAAQSYAADMGQMFGDSLEKKARPRAIAIFMAGFWILDVANNMLQAPCRALLANLAAGDQRKMRTANAGFSFFVGWETS
ncbi:hypothetical protein AHAS_Ahas13G0099100 [Arachis hypogaea]